MRRVQLVMLFSIVCCCANGYASLTGYVDLQPISGSSFTSRGYAAWYGLLGETDPTAELTGEHKVSGDGVTYTTPVSATGTYDNDVTGPAEAGTCYNTTLSITVDRGWSGSTSATYSDGSECAPIGNGRRDGWGMPGCPTSPVVIALNDRYEFTDIQSGVDFDIDADGDMDRVAWTRDGSMAFLFFDRNGNHLPDDGSELFGDHTRLRNGTVAQHGFEALAEFDSNADGVVSAADSNWLQLSVWQDRDHNGVAVIDEISTLPAHGIASLGINCHWTGRRDAHGNLFRWQSEIVRDGNGGSRPYYDVYLLTQVAP